MGTVVGSWRLKIILVLVLVATMVYMANAMFYNLGATVDENGYITYENTTDDVIAYNQTDIGTEKSVSFVDVLTGLTNFITFGNVDNQFARVFLNVVMSIILISIGYIVFTFIKEWIPLV